MQTSLGDSSGIFKLTWCGALEVTSLKIAYRTFTWPMSTTPPSPTSLLLFVELLDKRGAIKFNISSTPFVLCYHQNSQ